MMIPAEQAVPGVISYGGSAPPSSDPAVAWSAVTAGAVAAAALSLILFVLGVGFGLLSATPWTLQGISVTEFGVSTIVWVTAVQILASGMGGYLAGRLRAKWQGTHEDEIHFRDTAHGFLAWAVATLLTATLLASMVGSIITGASRAAATAASGIVSAGAAAAGSEISKTGDSGYYVDSLFRSQTNVLPIPTAVKGRENQIPTIPEVEVTRIFANAVRTETLPPEDARYLGSLVARTTGLSQDDSEKRVADTFERLKTDRAQMEASVKHAADTTSKASAYAALWLFVSLLIGAFTASLFAVFGGRHRIIR